MNRRHAFTAIELLVVIVIIGTLLFFLSPTICTNGSRERARRAQCMNNLKQIGLAGEQYSEDFGHRLPCGQSSVFANAGLMSNWLGTAKLLVCPSSLKTPVRDFDAPQASDAANVSYTQQAALSTGMIWQANADEVLYWDQGVAGNACGPAGGIGLKWAVTSNHKTAGGSVLFNDGHVAWQLKTPTNMPLGCLNP